jgi:hypothetical protein
MSGALGALSAQAHQPDARNAEYARRTQGGVSCDSSCGGDRDSGSDHHGTLVQQPLQPRRLTVRGSGRD